MENILVKMRHDKEEYNRQMQRVKLLPTDYQFVYHKIENYMWNFAAGSGMDMLKTQYDLIDLFEEAATQGRHVLEVTGEDVATFCDDLMRGNKLWTDRVKEKLNEKMKTKLDK